MMNESFIYEVTDFVINCVYSYVSEDDLISRSCKFGCLTLYETEAGIKFNRLAETCIVEVIRLSG